MMHVDKNANGHVLDQNVDRISKEIAYVPLSGRIRSKRSHACSPFLFLFLFFFFFGKKMSTRHTYQWSQQNEDFSRDLEFWTYFLGVQGFEFWMCFVEVQ